jgi:hypothetical protein
MSDFTEWCADVELNRNERVYLAAEVDAEVERLRTRGAQLEAECVWWHNRAWEIDSAYTFHNSNTCLDRDVWEKQQQELKEADEQENNDE